MDAMRLYWEVTVNGAADTSVLMYVSQVCFFCNRVNRIVSVCIIDILYEIRTSSIITFDQNTGKQRMAKHN